MQKSLYIRHRGCANQAIAERLDININTIKLCLNKFKTGGIQKVLFDEQRKCQPMEIMDDAIAWILRIACQRPVDLGYSQELWTLKNLHAYIQSHVSEAGYQRLTTITKPMVQKILSRNKIKPFKIKYYCEKRGPDFEQKMYDVLLIISKCRCSLTNMVIP